MQGYQIIMKLSEISLKESSISKQDKLISKLYFIGVTVIDK